MLSACILGYKIVPICVVFVIGLGIGIEFGLGAQAKLLSPTGSKKCHDVCPIVYRVVCALDVLDGCFRTFTSTCVMRIYNCKYQKDYRIIADRACEFITNDELRRIAL